MGTKFRSIRSPHFSCISSQSDFHPMLLLGTSKPTYRLRVSVGLKRLSDVENLMEFVTLGTEAILLATYCG